MAVGLLSTVNNPPNLNSISFAKAITHLAPNGTAPLFGLTSLLQEERATNIEHGYFSKTMVFPFATVNGAAVAGDTTITVLAYTHLVPGALLLNETTNEVVLVTGTPGPTSLTVVRGVGTIAGAAMAVGQVLRTIGNAFEQGSVRPAPVSVIAERYVNLTQIFRDSWGVTNTASAVPEIAGDGTIAEARSYCAMLHAASIEKSLFFGQRFAGTRNGQPFQTQEGIIRRVTAAAPGNISTLLATTNWTQFEAAVDPTMQTVTNPRTGNIRTMFVGGTARRVLHNIARLNSTYQITSNETVWGLQLDTLRIPRGTLEIIEHPLFNAYGPASPWARMAVIVDLNAFAIAYLRKTHSQEYNGRGTPVDNGIDAQGGTLTTELTSVIKNPAGFGVIHNFTAAAAG